MPREDKSALTTGKQTSDSEKENSQSPKPVCEAAESSENKQSSVVPPAQEIKETSGDVPKDCNGEAVLENLSEESVCSKCGGSNRLIGGDSDTSSQDQLICKCVPGLHENREEGGNKTNLEKDTTVRETEQIDMAEAGSKSVSTPGESSLEVPLDQVKQISSDAVEGPSDCPTSYSASGNFQVVTIIAQNPHSQEESIQQQGACGSDLDDLNKHQECPNSDVAADEVVNIIGAKADESCPECQKEVLLDSNEQSAVSTGNQQAIKPFYKDRMNQFICLMLVIISIILGVIIGAQVALHNKINSFIPKDMDRNSTREE